MAGEDGRALLRRLVRTGKQVVSVAEPDINAEDGHRKLVRVILGVIAEYEVWLIAVRLRAARDLKRSRGGYAATPFHRRPVYRRACPDTFTNAGAPRQSLILTGHSSL